MLSNLVHLHKNRLNGTVNVILIFIPALIFALTVILTYTYLINYSNSKLAYFTNQNTMILGTETVDVDNWDLDEPKY